MPSHPSGSARPPVAIEGEANATSSTDGAPAADAGPPGHRLDPLGGRADHQAPFHDLPRSGCRGSSPSSTTNPMNTILITGSSSGFGLETARLFLSRGWRVVATMRTPRDDLLPVSDRLRVLALDVTDPQSIEQAVDAAGPIDALVNNAGIGLMGAFEGSSLAAVRELFETNTLGTMAVTQAMLQQFRQRRRGVIVNVSSAITLKPLPLSAADGATQRVAVMSPSICDPALLNTGSRGPDQRAFACSANARIALDRCIAWRPA